MRLSKQTSYAIRILALCAREQGELVKVADIARALDISPQNTFKSVHVLAKAGLLAPVRGRNGGVRLARPPSMIRVSDVLRAVEFNERPAARRSADGDGDAASRPISRVLDEALKAFLSVLDGHTIDLLAEPPATAGRSRSRGSHRRQPADPASVKAPRRAL